MPDDFGYTDKLVFKVPATQWSWPSNMKACLASNNITIISEVLDSAGLEIKESTVGPLAYSYSYSDEKGTTKPPAKQLGANEVLDVYFIFDVANLDLKPGQTYYIYVYRTSVSQASIYGAGTYGAGQATNIPNYSLTLHHRNTAATVMIKASGEFKQGLTYIKVKGEWRSATAVYTKVKGVWKLSSTTAKNNTRYTEEQNEYGTTVIADTFATEGNDNGTTVIID
jgi:hypothetical protein